MCTYSTANKDALIDHVCKIHRHDPNFLVYCSNCLRSYRKWDSYRKHLSRGCGLNTSCTDQLINLPPPVDSNSDVDPMTDINSGSPLERETNEVQAVSQKWHEAAFILTIKEKYAVSQTAIDHTLFSVNELISSVLKVVLGQLKGKLSVESMEIITQVLKDAFPLFSGLSTAYLQQKFFKETFNVIVST